MTDERLAEISLHAGRMFDEYKFLARDSPEMAVTMMLRELIADLREAREEIKSYEAAMTEMIGVVRRKDEEIAQLRAQLSAGGSGAVPDATRD